MLQINRLAKISVSKRRWVRHAAIIVFASALVAVAGPFGTPNLDIGVRFLYWLGGISIGWAQWVAIVRILHRLTSANPWPPGVCGTVAAFIFAGLMTGEIVLVRGWLLGASWRAGAVPFLGILGLMLAYCWFGQLLVRLVSGGAPAGPEESDGGGEVRFLKRIPVALPVNCCVSGPKTIT